MGHEPLALTILSEHTQGGVVRRAVETYGRRGENGEYIRARSTQISEKVSGETMSSKEAWALGFKGSCAPALV